jgi:L,D-transpeptidase catalytic domain
MMLIRQQRLYQKKGELMKFLIPALIALTVSLSAMAQDSNVIEDLNPFDPSINETLQKIDQDYQTQTGQPGFQRDFSALFEISTCYRLQCTIYARVVKAEQKLFLYVNGRLDATWPVSSGMSGYGTPDFDQHPNGRIYDRYTSTKFPGGDYKGLGNMPYVVFINGGFAIHGTTGGNIPKLGTPASHGCIRVHPENGKIFNRLVRQYGVKDVWITVE